jgi:hypothetical protein
MRTETAKGFAGKKTKKKDTTRPEKTGARETDFWEAFP